MYCTGGGGHAPSEATPLYCTGGTEFQHKHTSLLHIHFTKLAGQHTAASRWSVGLENASSPRAELLVR